MENPIKMDDLGVPLFSETSKSLGIPITERQMMSMLGVYNHLRNGRYLGSMLPFSVSVSQDP